MNKCKCKLFRIIRECGKYGRESRELKGPLVKKHPYTQVQAADWFTLCR